MVSGGAAAACVGGGGARGSKWSGGGAKGSMVGGGGVNLFLTNSTKMVKKGNTIFSLL